MIIGHHANAWNAATPGVNGLSAIIDLQDASTVDVIGNTSGASTITLLVSADGGTFYAHGTTIAANGDFIGSYIVGARFARLKSSAAVTITASIVGK